MSRSAERTSEDQTMTPIYDAVEAMLGSPAGMPASSYAQTERPQTPLTGWRR